MHNEHGRLLRGGEMVRQPGDLTRTGYVRDCGALYATVAWDDGSTEEVDTLFHGLDLTRFGVRRDGGHLHVPGLAVPA